MVSRQASSNLKWEQALPCTEVNMATVVSVASLIDHELMSLLRSSRVPTHLIISGSAVAIHHPSSCAAPRVVSIVMRLHKFVYCMHWDFHGSTL